MGNHPVHVDRARARGFIPNGRDMLPVGVIDVDARRRPAVCIGDSADGKSGERAISHAADLPTVSWIWTLTALGDPRRPVSRESFGPEGDGDRATAAASIEGVHVSRIGRGSV